MLARFFDTLSFATPFISALLTLVFILLLSQSKLADRLMARHNHRSSHKIPVPKIGGIAMITSIALAWFFLGIQSWWMILLLMLILAFISFLDDLGDISVVLRLGIHFGAASMFALGELRSELSWFIVPAILAIAWMINLYNFMDGIDGLSGGMAVIGFSAYAFAALYGSQDLKFVLGNVCIVAASLIFLCFNFAPAKIFMGDAGSTTLGFLAAAFGLYGWQHHYWPLWFPVIVFLPFILDATLTLCKRLFRGEKIWHAHREHYYQRMLRMGWPHRKTTLAAYVLMFSCALAAVILSKQTPSIQLGGIVMVLGAMFSILSSIDRRWQRQAKLS